MLTTRAFRVRFRMGFSMTRLVLHTLAWLVLASPGCSSNGALPCFWGNESCPCYANGTCNTGLVCEAQRCVTGDELPGVGGRGADAGDDAERSEAGSGGLAGTRTSAGSRAVDVPAQAPRKNGETCSVAKDCASGICERNKVGEQYCYGTAGPNEACRDVFDCRGGLCVGRTSDTLNPVCVDGIAACEELGQIGTCTEELAIASCQLDELCDAPKSRLDFNSCVRYGCAYWHDNPPSNGCEAQLSFARGGKANCSKD
jgi:hypothetical protein